MSFEFYDSEAKLKKLEVKCRYLLNQMKVKSKKTWSTYVDSFNDAEIDELPAWYEEALAAYNGLPEKK